MSVDEERGNDIMENGGKESEKDEVKLIFEKKNKWYIGSFEYRANQFCFSAVKKREREREREREKEREKESKKGFMLAAFQNIDNILPDE